MSEDRRGVVVGLDVHKSSVRLAALRDGELLREVKLGYNARSCSGGEGVAGCPGLPGGRSERVRVASRAGRGWGGYRDRRAWAGALAPWGSREDR